MAGVGKLMEWRGTAQGDVRMHAGAWPWRGRGGAVLARLGKSDVEKKLCPWAKAVSDSKRTGKTWIDLGGWIGKERPR